VIVTVTLDPALHVQYQAERIAWGGSNQVRRVRHRAGGRGLAVARVLHTFGHDVMAAGLAGGTAGELLRSELAAAGVATQFTRIAMESRRVVEVRDGSRQDATTFSEPAPYITTEELGRLAADYRALLDGASAAVLCGGLPSGLPAETYASLASYAAEAGVPVVLDAGGEVLRHALGRRPALAIPEDGESADPAAAVAAGASAAAVLSGGEVQVATGDGRWLAQLARPLGPGELGRPASGPCPAEAWPSGWRDALVAGFVPGIVLGWSWPESLVHAVAMATAAGQDGEIDLVRYESQLAAVRVREAAS
jgi:tagatose 6-phosphate kinase